jgi:predicted methyltransferase
MNDNWHKIVYLQASMNYHQREIDKILEEIQELVKEEFPNEATDLIIHEPNKFKSLT